MGKDLVHTCNSWTRWYAACISVKNVNEIEKDSYTYITFPIRLFEDRFGITVACDECLGLNC